jgi:hypothetical protein
LAFASKAKPLFHVNAQLRSVKRPRQKSDDAEKDFLGLGLLVLRGEQFMALGQLVLRFTLSN